MVSNLRLADGQVAQAVYTWSSRLVDGSKGLGFSTISPSLEKSIDWLTRLQPPEFKLFTTNNPSPELYEARRRFSEVGRTVRGQISIVYRKTADGTVDVSGRPQPVVHALLANTKTFGLLSASRIRQDLWIPEIEQQSVAGLELGDIAFEDTVDPTNPIASHICPNGHDDARSFLRSLIGLGIQGEGNIVVSSYPETLAQMLLAFPSNVVDGFCHASYVTLEGVRHEIGLRLPRHDDHSNSTFNFWQRTEFCPLKQATKEAATKYLFTGDASIGKYAEAVLKATALPIMPNPVHSQSSTRRAQVSTQRASEDATDETRPESSTILDAMQSIRIVTDDERFTKKENLELLERLR